MKVSQSVESMQFLRVSIASRDPVFGVTGFDTFVFFVRGNEVKPDMHPSWYSTIAAVQSLLSVV